MQGVDFSKLRGGKKGQKELSQAIAMDAASRVMTRKALDMLKSIATGNYKTFEEREAEAKKAEVVAEAAAKNPHRLRLAKKKPQSKKRLLDG
jgi:O6-methylguanine-DNA--protein-cysteine methyltransferase